jgi:PilZ domain
MTLVDPCPDPLELARAVLPTLPCRAMVVGEDSRCVEIEVVAVAEGHLVAEPVADLGPRVVVVLVDQRRAGYEIGCVVVPEDAHQQTPRLRVEWVRRAKPRRQHVRAGVAESGLVRADPDESEFDVRVVDISAAGVAFVCERQLWVGDSVSAMLNIENRSFPVKARVIHTHPLGFGRTRVGCQFTAISEDNRAALANTATQSPSDRRQMRPIELLNTLGAAEGGAEVASMGAVQYERGEALAPVVRYCRACARLTVHVVAAAPGEPPTFTCSAC